MRLVLTVSLCLLSCSLAGNAEETGVAAGFYEPVEKNLEGWEYFAESTEAYLGVNDFYPFVRAELNRHDPRMYRLLRKIWGPVK